MGATGIDVPPSGDGLKVLVTGGLGFIGSHLARRLAGHGHDVTLVDNLMPEHGGNLFNVARIDGRVQINISDMRDASAMRHLVKGRDVIFNLAGQSSHIDSIRNPYADADINSRAQITLLESCRRYNPGVKVLYASTRQIYGKPDYLPVDEKHPLRPVDINGINKMAGEMYHTLYHQIYGMDTCSLRLTNTYGPHMRVKDSRQNFLGIWIKRILDGQPIEIFGSGTQVRDFSYVDDVVDAFLACAGSDRAAGEVFNVGSGEAVSLVDVARLLIEINRGGEYRLIPFPPERKVIDIGDYYTDYGKIRDMIGWQPGTALRDGLERTLGFYRTYGKHYWE
ncbi:MAG: dTDP-glucose 4,6-dehydratase [Methanocella sp. PtaU1.Bin125]|nr:MAG: dTDP-glucose 4,6-dehydratase [Methanocella sp. PtaU1.Bin125]